MVVLTENKIKDLISEPKNKKHIVAGRKDNEWQSFHCKPSTSAEDSGNHRTTFLRKVSDILDSKDKYSIFEKLMSYPLPSQQIVSKATDELNKIFEGQDKIVECRFTDPNIDVEFSKFLEEEKIDHLVRQNIFTAAKQSINTFVVIDYRNATSENQVSDPYAYLVEFCDVIDADETQTNDIEYIIYKATDSDGKNIIVAIDGVNYWVFDENTSSGIALRYSVPHNIGYCPVATVWNDSIDPIKKPLRRFNSCIEALSDMDKLVMADIFSQHMDLYAAFVLMWRFVDQCEYREGDIQCNEGFLEIPNEGGTFSMKKCPACSAKGVVGPGTIVEIPLPETKDQPDIGTPIGFTEPGTDILIYNQDKISKLSEKIEKNITGSTLKTTDNEAINEDQVRSQYQSKQDILMYWAENFQKIHGFIIKTLAIAKYGDRYMDSVVNYGTDFFLIDVNTAVKDYSDAKEAGLPMYLITEKREIVENLFSRLSKSKGNRLQILKLLEPYLDVSLSQLDKNTLEYELKANFSYYIAQFEMQFGPITTFASETSNLMTRVNFISNKLYNYARERKSKQQSVLREFGQGEEVSSSGQVEGRSGSTPNEKN